MYEKHESFASEETKNRYEYLPDELLLRILNSTSWNNESILSPSDIVSAALSCLRIRNVSNEARNSTIPIKYGDIREHADDYQFFKNNKLNKLYQDKRSEYEKKGYVYYDKSARNVISCLLGLVLAATVALLYLDANYFQFLLMVISFSTVMMITNIIQLESTKPPLNSELFKQIPIQFYDEKLSSHKP
jgi:hypothetical protein